MHSYRSHTCGAMSQTDVGQTVRLSGWVHRKRDHGGVLFVDLRDHYGITQIVADGDSPALAVSWRRLRVESVVTIDGAVKSAGGEPRSKPRICRPGRDRGLSRARATVLIARGGAADAGGR